MPQWSIITTAPCRRFSIIKWTINLIMEGVIIDNDNLQRLNCSKKKRWEQRRYRRMRQIITRSNVMLIKNRCNVLMTITATLQRMMMMFKSS
eukprot:scaffold27624_cov52-Cyclotella_meneghiniana.AAC.1